MAKKSSLILGIESSCDECSAAVLSFAPGRFEARSVATFSQVRLHQPFGGVVPEIASRNHLETINAMIDEAIQKAEIDPSQLDAIAVTNRPGLVGALLVGVSAAKAMAYAFEKPLVPVHHLEGHALSLFLDQDFSDFEERFPILLALVSGGHTQLYVVKEPPERWSTRFLQESLVGRSRDDAAGEAFDKTAKILGFPYPGGAWIDKKSEGGNPHAFSLPRALSPAKNEKSPYDFSFSGLKTAVALLSEKIRKEGSFDAQLTNLCASIQEAIVDALATKIFLAARDFGCRSVALVGGVAANRSLRERLEAESQKHGFHSPLLPKMKYCTDNAAMIAAAGALRWSQGNFLSGESLLKLNAIPYPES